MDADKNLGIAVLTKEDYIQLILKKHLRQTDIYERLSDIHAHQRMKEVE